MGRCCFQAGPSGSGRDHPQLLALEWGESNSSHWNWGRRMESSCPSPRQNVAAVIILECGLGLPISESPYASSLRCSNALDTDQKSETSACCQQASFLVGSLLTLPTTSCGFLRLPESPSTESFPSVAGNGLNSTELSPCFFLLNCTFQLYRSSSFYCCPWHRRSPNDAPISFSPILVFLTKTVTVTCLYLSSRQASSKSDNLRNFLQQ